VKRYLVLSVPGTVYTGTVPYPSLGR
jgi:hypothetical protein